MLFLSFLNTLVLVRQILYQNHIMKDCKCQIMWRKYVIHQVVYLPMSTRY